MESQASGDDAPSKQGHPEWGIFPFISGIMATADGITTAIGSYELIKGMGNDINGDTQWLDLLIVLPVTMFVSGILLLSSQTADQILGRAPRAKGFPRDFALLCIALPMAIYTSFQTISLRFPPYFAFAVTALITIGTMLFSRTFFRLKQMLLNFSFPEEKK